MNSHECTNDEPIRAFVANTIPPMNEIIYKEESYKIIGLCMEVHNNLGAGFLEIVYKDALEYDFRKAHIPYEREKQYAVNYKGIILPHKFYGDFVLMDKIILEIKTV